MKAVARNMSEGSPVASLLATASQRVELDTAAISWCNMLNVDPDRLNGLACKPAGAQRSHCSDFGAFADPQRLSHCSNHDGACPKSRACSDMPIPDLGAVQARPPGLARSSG